MFVKSLAFTMLLTIEMNNVQMRLLRKLICSLVLIKILAFNTM
jgi:hypothetical protein